MIRFIMRRSVVALLLIAVAAGLALAGTVRADEATPDAHAGHHAASTPAMTDACAATAAQPTPGTGMGMTGSPMAGMTMPEEFDLVFIDMMTVHHRGAIAMARVAVARGEHQEVRDLAQAIVTTPQAELDQLTAWRNAWYPGAAAMPMDQVGQLMDGMMQGMPGMMGTPRAGMGEMGGMMGMMDPQAGVQALCSAAGPFDQVFLQLMIPHHQSAVMLAQVALTQATHPEIKQLAQAIVDTQQREITEMQGWLAAWYGATPAASQGATVAEDVAVTLTEFRVTSSASTFRVGQTYRFVVTNAGVLPHEFMILPKMEGMEEMDMAELDAIALAMIPVDDLPPGATRTIEVTFTQPAAAGSLELVCDVEGHYDAGMALPIEVVA